MGLFSRHLRLLFLATALVVAAFSTGIEFLFFLVYLTAAIVIGSWLYARRGLRGVRADYRVLNPRTHVGEILQAMYRVENHDRLAKPWIECWNESTLPNSLPGRVVGIGARGTRQWLAKVTLTRRGSFRLGALRVRTGDPFGLFSSEMMVRSEILQAMYRVENHDRLAKPWIECWNESTLPNSLPGRVVGIGARGTRQWLAKVTLTRRGSFRLGALRVRTGDPFGLFSSEMMV